MKVESNWYQAQFFEQSPRQETFFGRFKSTEKSVTQLDSPQRGDKYFFEKIT